MPEIYISSDPHLGHGGKDDKSGILSFKRNDGVTRLRDFETIQEHDEYIIAQHNSVVRPQDKWYCLGDVVMNPRKLHIVARMNGHKRLVMGNHDEAGAEEYLKYFDELYSIRVLDRIAFTHIPIHPESLGRFIGNVHGHIHHQESPSGKYQNGKDVIRQRYLNVSMEMLPNYIPLTLGMIKERLSKWSQEFPI
jgi:calcineurin-like phosphoesterase family protein